MKTHGKQFRLALSTATAAAVCIGMGADALRGTTDQKPTNDRPAAQSPQQALSALGQVADSARGQRPGPAHEGASKTLAGPGHVPTTASQHASSNNSTASGSDRANTGRSRNAPTPISFPNAQTLDFDVTGILSIGNIGDPANEVFSLNLGPNVTVIGLGWDVTLEQEVPGWLADMRVEFTDTDGTTGVGVTPGIEDEGPGIGSYSSDGILNLANFDLAFEVGADGMLRLEFWETFVDFASPTPDGEWLSGTLTIQYISTGAACPGDLSGDGNVDVSDLLALLSAWGPCGDPGNCPADISGDGAVDVSDLLALLSAWGACPPGGGDAIGACCMPDFSCMEKMSEDDCLNAGGEYGGDWTDCDVCPAEPTGETCDTAFPLAPGQSHMGSTAGNDAAGSPTCGGQTPNQPAAWYVVTGNGNQMTLDVDTTLFGPGSAAVVYCGTCATLECVAGATSNGQGDNPFDARLQWCAADGATYFVAVWRTGNSPGDYTVSLSEGNSCTPTVVCDSGQVFPPVCELDDADCQLRAGGTYATSDTTAGFAVADDFQAAETGTITSVCWEGVELLFSGGFQVCSNNQGQGNEFRVTYYEDNGGLPGAQIAQFTGNPEYSRTAFIGFAFGDAGLFNYTMDHAPVAVTNGACYWVEIVQVNPSAGCYFLWSPSDQGNLVAAQAELDAGYTVADLMGPGDWTNPDRAFCINIDRGPGLDCVAEILGACCVDGVCTGDVLEADCDGIWFIDTPCGAGVCPDEEYVYDSGTTTNSLGWGDGGVFMWMHRFDVDGGGNDVINEVSTSFNNVGGTPGTQGVIPGQTFGVAIMQDTGAGPGAVLWQTTANATAAAVNTDALQTVSTGGVNVSGSFYVAVWVQHAAGTFPSPMDESQVRPDGDVFFAGTVGGTFGTFDPAAPTNAPTDVNAAGFPTVWLLRAD